MPKPEWLEENENKPPKQYDSLGREKRKVPYCTDCKYYLGKPIKYNGQHKGTGPHNVEHWACKKHPACINTMYSLSCDDFEYA